MGAWIASYAQAVRRRPVIRVLLSAIVLLSVHTLAWHEVSAASTEPRGPGALWEAYPLETRPPPADPAAAEATSRAIPESEPTPRPAVAPVSAARPEQSSSPLLIAGLMFGLALAAACAYRLWTTGLVLTSTPSDRTVERSLVVLAVVGVGLLTYVLAAR